MGEIVESNRLKNQEKLKFCSLHELNPKVTQFKYLKIKFEGNRLARKATIKVFVSTSIFPLNRVAICGTIKIICAIALLTASLCL